VFALLLQPKSENISERIDRWRKRSEDFIFDKIEKIAVNVFNLFG